jgi:hypothetical protein
MPFISLLNAFCDKGKYNLLKFQNASANAIFKAVFDDQLLPRFLLYVLLTCVGLHLNKYCLTFVVQCEVGSTCLQSLGLVSCAINSVLAIVEVVAQQATQLRVGVVKPYVALAMYFILRWLFVAFH